MPLWHCRQATVPHNSLVLYVLVSTFIQLRYYKQLLERLYPKT